MSAGVIIVSRDVRDFVAHQLAQEIENGAPLAAATESLRRAVPQDYHWAIADAERVLSGGPAPAAWSQLGDLLTAARDNGISAERTFAAFERSAHAARAQVAQVLAGAMSLGVYLMVLGVLLAVVLCMYSVYVMPRIESMFTEFGAELPRFTQATVANSAILVPTIAVFLFALVAYIVGVSRLRKRLHALQPVLPVLRRIPGLARWARGHDAALWMRYYAIFLDAGAPDAAASRAAAQLVPPPENDHRLRLLESGAKLGRLRESLARLLEVEDREAAERFERPRNTVFLLARLFVYLIVVAYVLAMYLPIFKLGAVV